MTTTAEAKRPTQSTQDKRQNPLALIAQGLEARREQFRMMLPSHISAEHFERVVMTAVNIDPELITADRRSLFNACARAANDGLLPDKREGALVVFKDKDGNRLVTWMPMVYGLIKKIRQSGEIDSIGARIVYQREIEEASPSHPTRKRFEFIIEDGQEKLFHEPMLWGNRGEKVLVYAYARFKDSGVVQYMAIHKDDVIKRRKAARTDKVWASWEEEMWLKTAIRAIASKLPLSTEIRTPDDEHDEPTEFDKMRNAAIASLASPVEDGVVTEVTDAPTPPPPEPELEPEPSSAASMPAEPAGLFAGDPAAEESKKTTISPDQFVQNAIAGLEDPSFTSVAELEDYAQRMRMGLIQMQPPLDDRRRLLSMFNKAALERITALQPGARA